MGFGIGFFLGMIVGVAIVLSYGYYSMGPYGDD